MLYAGLDLSRKRLDFHLLDAEGATVEVGAAPPDADGLLGLTRRLDRHHEPIEQSKSLAELGYLDTSQTKGQRNKPVTLYRITDRGRQAVRRWASTRVEIPPIDSDVFLRVRAASFVPPQLIRNGLRYLRPELTRRLAAVDELEAKLAQRVPPLHDKLELDLVRTILKAYLRWLSRAEKELAREVSQT